MEAAPNSSVPAVHADPPSMGCLDDPNFATICSFIEKFGEVCRIDALPFAELQEMIEDTNEVCMPLIQLHVRLLRRVFKSIAVDKWERSLAKFGHTYCAQDGWEIERFGYKKAKIQTKLRLLKNLLEAQFDFNVKFKSEVNKIPASDLRLVPIGRDTEGQLYWYQVDPDANLRVYREDVDDETWEVVATSKEEMMALISQLQRGEVKKPLIPDDEVIVEEDSNGKDIETKEILLDTGKVQEEEEEESENEIDDGEPDWKESDDSVDEEAMEIDEEYVAPEEVVVNPTVVGDSNVFPNTSNNLTLNPSDRERESEDKVNISPSEWSIKGSDSKTLSALHSRYEESFSYTRSQKVEPLTLRKEMIREEKINTSKYPYIAVKSSVKYEEPMPSFENITEKHEDVVHKIEDSKPSINDVVADRVSVTPKLENQTLGAFDYTVKPSELKKVRNEKEIRVKQLSTALSAPSSQLEAKHISSEKASIPLVLASKSKPNEAKPPPFTLPASSIQMVDNDKPPLLEKVSTVVDSKSKDNERKPLPIALDISINEVSIKPPFTETVTTTKLGLGLEPENKKVKQTPSTVHTSSTQAGQKLPLPVKVSTFLVSETAFTENKQQNNSFNTSNVEDTLPLPEKVPIQNFGPESKYGQNKPTPFTLDASYIQRGEEQPENLSLNTTALEAEHSKAKQPTIIASDLSIIPAEVTSFANENVSTHDVGRKDFRDSKTIKNMEKPVEEIDNKIFHVKPEHVPDNTEKHSDPTQCKDKILKQDEMSLSHDIPQNIDPPSVKQKSTTSRSNNRTLNINDIVQEIKREKLNKSAKGAKLNTSLKIRELKGSRKAAEFSNSPRRNEFNNPPNVEELNESANIKGSNTPVVDESNKFPQSVEISKSIETEKSNNFPQNLVMSKFPKMVEFNESSKEDLCVKSFQKDLIPPKQEAINIPSHHEGLNIPLKSEDLSVPPKKEAIHIEMKCEDLTVPSTAEERDIIYTTNPAKLNMPPNPIELNMRHNPVEFNMPPNPVEFNMPPNPFDLNMPQNPVELIIPPNPVGLFIPPNPVGLFIPPNPVGLFIPPNPVELIIPPNSVELKIPPIKESIVPLKTAGFNIPPNPIELNMPPNQVESKVPSTKVELIVPPKTPELNIPPTPAELIVEPRPDELIVEATPPELNVQPNPAELHVQPTPAELNEQPNPAEATMQSNPVVFTAPTNAVLLNSQPNTAELNMQPNPAEVNIRPNPVVLTVPPTPDELNIPSISEDLSLSMNPVGLNMSSRSVEFDMPTNPNTKGNVKLNIRASPVDLNMASNPIELNIPATPVELDTHPNTEELNVQPTPTELNMQPTPAELNVQPTPDKLNIPPNPVELNIPPNSADLKIPPSKIELIEPAKTAELNVQPAPDKLNMQPNPAEVAVQSNPLVLTMPPNPVVLNIQSTPVEVNIQANPVVLTMPMPPNPVVSSIPTNPDLSTIPPNPVMLTMPPNPVLLTMPPNPVVLTVPPNSVVLTMPPNPVVLTMPPNPVVLTMPPNPVVLTMPPNPAELNIPPISKELSLPMNPVGLNMSSRSEELDMPGNPNTKGNVQLNIPPNSVDLNMPINSAELNMSSNLVELNIPSNTRELNMPSNTSELSVPSKKVELKIAPSVDELSDAIELNLSPKKDGLAILPEPENVSIYNEKEEFSEFSKKEESMKLPPNIEEGKKLMEQEEKMETEEISTSEHSKSKVDSLGRPSLSEPFILGQTKPEDSIAAGKSLESEAIQCTDKKDTEAVLEISRSSDDEKLPENSYEYSKSKVDSLGSPCLSEPFNLEQTKPEDSIAAGKYIESEVIQCTDENVTESVLEISKTSDKKKLPINSHENSKSKVDSFGSPSESEDVIAAGKSIESETIQCTDENVTESVLEISKTSDEKKLPENSHEIVTAIEESCETKMLINNTPLIADTSSPVVKESDLTETISDNQNTSTHEIKPNVEINVPTQNVLPEVSKSDPAILFEVPEEEPSKKASQIISEPRPSLDVDEIDSDDGMEISDLVIDTDSQPHSVKEAEEVPPVDIGATEGISKNISESQLSLQKPEQIDNVPVEVINDNIVPSDSLEVKSVTEETMFVDDSQKNAKLCSPAPSDTANERNITVTLDQESKKDSQTGNSDTFNPKLQEQEELVSPILNKVEMTLAAEIPEIKADSSSLIDVSTSKPLESPLLEITDAPCINSEVQKENPESNPPSEEASTIIVVEKSDTPALMEKIPEVDTVLVQHSVGSNETCNLPLEGEKNKSSNETLPSESTRVEEAVVSNAENAETAKNETNLDLATTCNATPSEITTGPETNTSRETNSIEKDDSESSVELKSVVSSSNEGAADELSRVVMPSVSSDKDVTQQPLVSLDLSKNKSTHDSAPDSKPKEPEISKPEISGISGLVGYEYSSSEDDEEMPTQKLTINEPVSSGPLKRKADDVLESAPKVPKLVESAPPTAVFNPIVGEAIEEDLMTIQGEGTGAENEGGNEELIQSATEEAGEVEDEEEEEIEVKPKGRGRPRKKTGAPRGRPVGSGRGGARANSGNATPRVRKRELENLSISFEGSQEINGGDLINDRPVRASRRIASIRQKEEEERRQLEEQKLAQLKAAQIKKQQKQVEREKKKAEKGDLSDTTPKTKKNKKENKEYLPSPSESESEEEDAEEGEEYEQKPTKLKKKRKRNKNGKAKRGGNPWNSSSSSEDEEAVEEEEEYHYEEEEEELVFNKSDHEFSPESDLGEDSDACPSRHARTAKRGEETVDKYEETNCDKCSKGDHPEWILLCDKCDKGWHASCVRPQLWVIPEGQWFCPPCQHNTLIEKLNENLIEYEKILKRRENEVLRKQRLAYVGISLDNVLPGAAPILEREDEHIIEKSEKQCRQDRYTQREKKSRRRRINSDDEDDELIGDDFINDNDSDKNSDFNSSDDQSDEPIYKLRARRATKSFNFKEYDDMINSALRVDDDLEMDEIEAPEIDKKPETSNGKGKSMSGDDEESEEEDSDPGGKVGENGEVSKVRKRILMSAKRTSSDEPAGKKMMEDTDEEELDEKEKIRRQELLKHSQRKTKRRLNDLDAPSDEDEDDSDEDFQGSGGDDDEDEDEEAVEDDSEWSGDREADESDDSIQRGARNKKQGGRLGRKEKYLGVGTVRRSTRRRRARISYDESDQDDEEEGSDKWVSDETEESESNSESEDETWGKKKKKAFNPPKSRFFQGPIVQSKPKTVKKKKRRVDDDEVDRAWSNNSSKAKKAAEEPVERRTRGRKINFKDILDSGESDDDGNIRPKRRRILSDSDDDSDAPTSSRKLIEEIKAQNAREAALYAASKKQNEKKAKAEPKGKPIVLAKEKEEPKVENEETVEDNEKHLLAEEQATAAVSALLVPKTKPIKSPETVQRISTVPPSLPSDSSSSSKGRSRSRSPNEKLAQLELELALAKPVPAPPFPPALAKALGRKSASNIPAFSLSMDNNINLLPPLGQPLPPQPPVSLSSSPTHPHLSHSPSSSPSPLSLTLPSTAPTTQTPPPARGSKKNNSINVPTPPKGSLPLPPAALTPPMPSMSPQQQQALPQGIRASLPSDIARLANPGLYPSNPALRNFHPPWRTTGPPQYGNPGAGIPSTSIGKPPPLNSTPFMAQQGSPRSGYPSPPPLRIPNPGNSPLQAFQHFKRDALPPGMPMYRMSPPPQQGGGPIPGILPSNMAALNQGPPDRYFGGPVTGGSPYGHPPYGLPPPHNQSPPQSIFPPFDYRIQHLQRPSEPSFKEDSPPQSQPPARTTSSPPPTSSASIVNAAKEEPPPPQGDGEFGGLVSYFSSRAEEDLDT